MQVFLYILFFYSGLIKSVFLFYDIRLPIDFTLLSALLLILSFVQELFRFNFKLKLREKYLKVLFFLLIFYCWILISLFYTESKEYSFIKTIYFITNIIAFFFPLLIRKFEVKLFLKITVLISFIFVFWYFLVDIHASSYVYKSVKYSVYAASYLAVSLLLGLNILICATTDSPLFKNKWNDIFIAVISFVLMLLIRGRGPLIFVVITVAAFLLYKFVILKKISFSLNKNKLIQSVLILTIIVITVIIVFKKYETQILSMADVTFRRLNLLLNGVENKDMGHSVDVRIDHIHNSVHLIFSSVYHFIFGYGIGSYGFLTTGIDIKDYPHNFILEIFVELGLIGLITFFMYFFINFFYYRKHNEFVSYFLLFFLFLNMMKSSSLVDIRIYFTFFAIFLITNSNKKLKEK